MDIGGYIMVVKRISKLLLSILTVSLITPIQATKFKNAVVDSVGKNTGKVAVKSAATALTLGAACLVSKSRKKKKKRRNATPKTTLASTNFKFKNKSLFGFNFEVPTDGPADKALANVTNLTKPDGEIISSLEASAALLKTLKDKIDPLDPDDTIENLLIFAEETAGRLEDTVLAALRAERPDEAELRKRERENKLEKQRAERKTKKAQKIKAKEFVYTAKTVMEIEDQNAQKDLQARNIIEAQKLMNSLVKDFITEKNHLAIDSKKNPHIARLANTYKTDVITATNKFIEKIKTAPKQRKRIGKNSLKRFESNANKVFSTFFKNGLSENYLDLRENLHHKIIAEKDAILRKKKRTFKRTFNKMKSTHDEHEFMMREDEKALKEEADKKKSA